MVSFLIHYRGDKVRRFNEWKDDPYRYLDAFVNDDLRTLGLPLSHTCACTWRSGVMKCMWQATEGSELERCIVERFESIRSDPRCLQELSMSIVSLHMDGVRMHVPAPGARAPPDTKYRQSVQPAKSFGVGKAPHAPTAISTARAAATPMAPRPKSKWSSQPLDFAPHLHDTIPPLPTRMKQEERSYDSALYVPREQRERPLSSTHGSPQTPHALPPRPSSSSRMSTAVPSSPTFSTQSARTSVTSLHPEPEPGAGELIHERSELGGRISALSAREKVLAQELAHRGVHLPPSSAEEREAMQREIASLRARIVEESQARRAAELALQQERRRRKRAAAVMHDVRRECNAPFVVPSLFDAFAEISRLTGECIPVGAVGGQ